MKPQQSFTNNQDNMIKEKGVLAGIFLIAIAGLLIANEYGVVFLPGWLFSWPMILIAVGVFSGISNGFRNAGFMVPILIGLFFLIRKEFPGLIPRNLIVPIFLMAFGAWLIFKPKGWSGRNSCRKNRGSFDTAGASTDEITPNEILNGDKIDEGVVFGSTRKHVVTKNFRGGEISAVFGSSEVNLTQAELIDNNILLELNAVFGSVKLIVPPHWTLKMENSAVLGGIEDKRPQHSIYSDKTLYLKNSAVFGGIEIVQG